MEKVFVFDVESLGLHGEGFSVGGGCYELNGEVLWEFLYATNPEAVIGDDDDRDWVKKNVPKVDYDCFGPLQVRRAFWKEWERAKEMNALMFAECNWPVEANFLRACVNDDLENRKWCGPYPLHDVATFLLAKGFNPMAIYPRLEHELPNHNPLCDARQSMRLLLTANRTYSNHACQ